jgi:glyoxylate reductase
MAARIVVTRRIPDPALELLEVAGDVWVSPHDRPLTTAELHSALGGADAAVTLLHDRVDAAFLDAAGPGLRVVANVAVGYDNVDVAACAARGVVCTNTPGVLTDATADLALALILASTRRLGEAERMVRAGGTWSWSMFFMLGSGLQGKTLGIVGLGQIGTATARRALAFGMRIAYTGRRPADPALEAELDATRLDLDELLATADVVSIHCPLSDATRHLIDARRLSLMKPTAYLINCARGPIVAEAALAQALRDGTIAGAGLDVFEHEPAIEPGLLELENVVLLPHLGSATIETRTAMGVLAARNAVAVLAGEPPLTPIT